MGRGDTRGDYITVCEDDQLFDDMRDGAECGHQVLQRDYRRSTSECCGVGACVARCWSFLWRRTLSLFIFTSSAMILAASVFYVGAAATLASASGASGASVGGASEYALVAEAVGAVGALGLATSLLALAGVLCGGGWSAAAARFLGPVAASLEAALALAIAIRADVLAEDAADAVPPPGTEAAVAYVASGVRVPTAAAIRYLALALLASLVLEVLRHRALCALRDARARGHSAFEDVELQSSASVARIKAKYRSENARYAARLGRA